MARTQTIAASVMRVLRGTSQELTTTELQNAVAKDMQHAPSSEGVRLALNALVEAGQVFKSEDSPRRFGLTLDGFEAAQTVVDAALDDASTLNPHSAEAPEIDITSLVGPAPPDPLPAPKAVTDHVWMELPRATVRALCSRALADGMPLTQDIRAAIQLYLRDAL